MDYDEFELDEEELVPPKPYTAEQRAAIDEMNANIAREFAELLSLC